MTDLPGSLGQEAVGANPPAAAPGWFGGAINYVVGDLVDQFGRLDELWITVWIFPASPDAPEHGWILREVRPAGMVPQAPTPRPVLLKKKPAKKSDVTP